MLRFQLLKGLTLLAIVVGGVSATAAGQPKAIPGIGPKGEIKKLHTDFKFTEGPAQDAEGNVYFSDIPNEKILKTDLSGKLTTFREKSNFADGECQGRGCGV